MEQHLARRWHTRFVFRCRCHGRGYEASSEETVRTLRTLDGLRNPVQRSNEVDFAAETGLRYLKAFLDEAGVQPDETGNTCGIQFPLTHSFLDDPDSALRIAYEIAGATVGGAKRLYFDQTQCTQVDLCAESVACALATHAKLNGVFVDGTYPMFPEAMACVAAFGVPAVLGDFVPEATPEVALWPLEHGNRGRSDSLRFPEWLQTQRIPARLGRQFPGHELKQELASRLATFLGEALDNAAEHGAGDWWIAASFRKLDEPLAGRCQIVIFNFGPTIQRTLDEMPLESVLRKAYKRLNQRHQQSGYFGENWTEENFWTVAALQEGVSRLGDSPGEGMMSLRGRGMIEIIRLFDYLVRTSHARQSPRMCLVSGRTSIHFDERFLLDEGLEVGRTRFIALNQPNDLARPANPSVVRNLRRYFPGMLISIQFHIGPHHLQPLPENQ